MSRDVLSGLRPAVAGRFCGPFPGGATAAQARGWLASSEHRDTLKRSRNGKHLPLLRYGIVFRKLLERETDFPPWRELFCVCRRIQEQRKILGGRFDSGFRGSSWRLQR